MSFDSPFWLWIISGLVGLFVALLPSFADLRINENGRVRVTRTGQLVLVLAAVGLVASLKMQQVSEQNQAREKRLADSVSYARALNQTALIRGDSEHLRELQQEALRQVDLLEAQQQTVLADLRRSQWISRMISDSLQQIVVVSRQVVDSLRSAEMRAAERTQETLTLVERTSNPVTTISSSINIRFEPVNPVAKLVIDSVYSQHSSRRSIVNRFMVDVGGRVEPARLPTEVVFTFWKSEDCKHPLDWERSLLTARRAISYDSTEFQFWTRGPDSLRSLAVRWEQGPLSIATNRSVSVDDLHGACVYVDLEWDGMLSDATGLLWDAATVWTNLFEFPYGRRAIIFPYSRIALQGGLELIHLPSEF